MAEASAQVAKGDPLLPLAWSRVFSPLVDDALRREAWEQLGLPMRFEDWQPAFFGAFHVGLPQAPATLQLNVLLGLDGGSVREDMVRILEHLELEWGENRLQPDHLACVLELLGVAMSKGEDVLVEGLCARYLEPWCDRAIPQLGGSAELTAIVEQLRLDLRECHG